MTIFLSYLKIYSIKQYVNQLLLTCVSLLGKKEAISTSGITISSITIWDSI